MFLLHTTETQPSVFITIFGSAGEAVQEPRGVSCYGPLYRTQRDVFHEKKKKSLSLIICVYMKVMSSNLRKIYSVPILAFKSLNNILISLEGRMSYAASIF